MGSFKKIAILSKDDSSTLTPLLKSLITFLQDKAKLFFQQEIAQLLGDTTLEVLSIEGIAKHCDLVIVIGGDGTILKVARQMLEEQVPVLGVNCGRLGFLADISPDSIFPILTEVLSGEYQKEEREVLTTTIYRDSKSFSNGQAINDVVLFNGDIARMIEFDVFIDEQFVMRQRSDGIIISSATGSTAYSLSAGGPILYPSLNVISLVPMCAHSLSSRPIVVNSNSKIKLLLTNKKRISPKISCDGQINFELNIGDEVHVETDQKKLQLIHPKNYNYYALLREKLGWHKQINNEKVKR